MADPVFAADFRRFFLLFVYIFLLASILSFSDQDGCHLFFPYFLYFLYSLSFRRFFYKVEFSILRLFSRSVVNSAFFAYVVYIWNGRGPIFKSVVACWKLPLAEVFNRLRLKNWEVPGHI